MKLKKFFPKRDPWSHKGQNGRVLVIGGSNVYSGSPIFNALAAYRTGADLVTLTGPERAMNIAATFKPDLITVPLKGDLSKSHVKEILKLAKNNDALVIGGGLERSQSTFKAVRELIADLDLPIVIDAEAIRAVAEDPKILQSAYALLTPHAEEFHILTGWSVKNDVKDRSEKVLKAARKLKTTILLKGHIDVISDGHTVQLNKKGSAFMTKGGFGDVLAGVAVALMARKIKALDAAQLAAFINGKAGEWATQNYGWGVMASDAIDFIPKVIQKYS